MAAEDLKNPDTGKPIRVLWGESEEATPYDLRILRGEKGLQVITYSRGKDGKAVASQNPRIITPTSDLHPKIQEHLKRFEETVKPKIHIIEKYPGITVEELGKMTPEDRKLYLICHRLSLSLPWRTPIANYFAPEMPQRLKPWVSSFEELKRYVAQFNWNLRNPYTGEYIQEVDFQNPVPGNFTFLPEYLPQEKVISQGPLQAICYNREGKPLIPLMQKSGKNWRNIPEPSKTTTLFSFTKDLLKVKG